MADMLATEEDLASLMQRLDIDAYTATMLLEIATGVIQDIAGNRIVQVTDTAVIDILDLDQWLELPQRPVNSVTTVVLDGVAITDWKLIRQKLWRLVGWLQSYAQPSQAVITYAHGNAPDSQYLQLGRGMALSLAQIGYGNTNPAVASVAIDDYKVTYAEALARMVDAVTPFMADRIRHAYGASAYVTSSTDS